MLINEILSEDLRYPLAGKAIFMAGVPGAGKSVISDGLFSQAGFQKIDIDEFLKLFQKRGQDTQYGADIEKIAEPARKRLSLLSQQSRNVIIDSTGRKLDSVLRNKKRLEDLGYQTAMVLVQRAPDQAVHAVMRRELQTGRTVDPEFIHDVDQALAQNVPEYQRAFGTENFFIINTDQGFPDSINFGQPIWPQLPASTARRIERFLKRPIAQ